MPADEVEWLARLAYPRRFKKIHGSLLDIDEYRDITPEKCPSVSNDWSLLGRGDFEWKEGA
jgi:hypothetical protein